MHQHLAGGVKLALIGNNLGVNQSGLTTRQKLTFLNGVSKTHEADVQKELWIEHGIICCVIDPTRTVQD
jgi:hypothetical protein